MRKEKWSLIKENLQKKGHSTNDLLTRRDLLSHGLMAFSATTLLPSFSSVFSRALADDCGGAANQMIPFLVFDCAGGAALPANFLVRNEKEELLPSYHLLGCDPKPAGAIENKFGAPMLAQQSRILTGLTQGATVNALANLRMGTFSHSAQSDSSVNPLSALALVARAGYRGGVFSSALGTTNSLSGGRSRLALPLSSYVPLFVSSFKDLLSAIDINPQNILKKATLSELGSWIDAAKNLSESQLKFLDSSPSSSMLAKLMNCSFGENKKTLTSGVATGLDPRLDPIYQQIYQINQTSLETTQAVVFASIVKGVLSGNTGPGVLTFNGCDYHNNTQTLGDAKDQEIGLYLGRAIEAAHRLKKPLFFQIITDGGCSNTPGTRVWVSDDNDKCMTIVGLYLPEGPKKMVRTQVGNYTDGQSANLNAHHGLGRSPFKVACSVFANYLKLHLSHEEWLRTMGKILPNGTFYDQTEMESMLFFS